MYQCQTEIKVSGRRLPYRHRLMAQVEAEVRAVQEECSNMDETECLKRASWRLIQLLSLAPSFSLSLSPHLSGNLMFHPQVFLVVGD